MKQLSIPKQSIATIFKEDNYLKDILQNLYFLAFGAFLGTMFADLKQILVSLIIIALLGFAARVIYLKLFALKRTIDIGSDSLTIRGESFNKKNIESLSYTQEPEHKDDYLKIKVKGFEERHICVYEEYYREDLRLYHFINDNFMVVKLNPKD